MPLCIKADGTEREVEGKLSLQAMQTIVGGYIQQVATRDGRYLIVDEDGKYKGKPVNEKATQLFWPLHDTIVGDVLVLTEEEMAQYRTP